MILKDLTETQKKTLFLLLRNKRMARFELASSLGITRASVSVQVKKLIDAGFLREAQKNEQNRRGQPSIALELVPRQAYSIGTSLSPDHISTVIMDLTGEILAEHREINTYDSILAASQAAQSNSESLIQRQALSASTLIGTGVSLPVNFPTPQSYAIGSSMRRWSGEDARQSLLKVFGPDLIVENDATAAAIGENVLGNQSNFSSFFYLYLGKGIGGAPIINGSALRGHFGNAGRVGALSRHPNLRPSVTSLGEEIERLSLLSSEPRDLSALFTQHSDTLEAWSKASITELSETIFQVTTILDPQGIVIGGTMPQSLRLWLKDRIQFNDLNYAFSQQVKCPKITVSQLPGDFAAAIGAATLFN